MNSNQTTARLAGLLYLILIITGVFHLLYAPAQLVDWDDPVLTLQNLRESETLFRWSIVSGILCYLSFLGLVLALYQLLHRVNKRYAQLMVILVVISVIINLANLLPHFAVLNLLGEVSYLPDLTDEERAVRVMAQLQAHNNGINLSQIPWGLWLFPFGYLVYRSGFLPRLLGVFLMLGCFSYLIEFFGGFLVPGYSDTLVHELMELPSSIGEFGICLWLLIMGTRTFTFRKRHPQTLSQASDGSYPHIA